MLKVENTIKIYTGNSKPRIKDCPECGAKIQKYNRHDDGMMPAVLGYSIPLDWRCDCGYVEFANYQDEEHETEIISLEEYARRFPEMQGL